MSIGWPPALAGLLALALPLWIHLRRRREIVRKVVSITRYVDAAPPPKRWQYVVEHPWLMLLRMAMITAVVAWLADVRLDDLNGGADATWTLVSPRTDAARVADLTGQRDAFWLAPGRPPLTDPRPDPDASTAWDALWAADRDAPAAVEFVVIGPATVSELGERRPRLSRSIRWIAAPGAFDESASTPELSVTLVTDASSNGDARRLERVVDAWRSAGVRVTLSRATAASTSQIEGPTFWLSDQPVPAGAPDRSPLPVVVTDGTATAEDRVLRLDADGQVLALGHVANGRRIVRVANLMHSDGALSEPGFATDLFDLVLGDEAWQPPASAPIAPASLVPAKDRTRAPPPMRLLGQPLAWLILLLAAAERWIAAGTLAPRSAR